MKNERWIIVPNWNGPTGFQHYKDRDPKWIKVYRRLHSNDDYLGLTGHRRAVLLGIWIEYASSHGQLKVNHTSLSRRFNLRVNSSDLEALNEAGFIEFSASKPLARPEQNDTVPLPRLREEKNREQHQGGSSSSDVELSPSSVKTPSYEADDPELNGQHPDPLMLAAEIAAGFDFPDRWVP